MPVRKRLYEKNSVKDTNFYEMVYNREKEREDSFTFPDLH